MTATRRAVIDVGTNSVKLLVADVIGGEVRPVLEDSEQTRLGKGFYETRHLQPRAIARTARAVAAFLVQSRQLGAADARVIATSAARDAMNGPELSAAIQKMCRAKVEIISGEQEADLAFRGVTTLPELARKPLMLLDVGGGSTEFILGRGEHRHFCKSFPVGSLRLMELLPHSNPPKEEELDECRRWVGDFLEHKVLPLLEPALRREVGKNSRPGAIQLVGTGGTASILARMEGRLAQFRRERIEGMELELDQIRAQVTRLWNLPLAKRKRIVGLPPKRADIILPGVVIYEMVMEKLGFSELRISTRGLRFAAVLDGAPQA